MISPERLAELDRVLTRIVSEEQVRQFRVLVEQVRVRRETTRRRQERTVPERQPRTGPTVSLTPATPSAYE